MEILVLREKIKRRRKEMNMTLRDLAGDRITPGQISLVESGRSNPSMDLLEYLANKLKTTVEYLMESEETQAQNICIYYEQITEACILTNDYEGAEKSIQKSNKYAKKYNLEYRSAKNTYFNAKIAQKRKQFTLAQKLYLESNKIFIKQNKIEDSINTFLSLGKVSLKIKAFYSSNSYLRQAEKAYLEHEMGNEFLISEIYYKMAEGHFKTENMELCNKYLLLAKEKLERVNDRKSYANNFMSISDDYAKNKDLKNATKYSKKGLEIYRELTDYQKMSCLENNLGTLFLEFGNTEEAYTHFQKAKEIRIRDKDNKAIESLLNMCKIYIKRKDIDRCENTFQEIQRIISRDDIKSIIDFNILKFRVFNIREEHEKAEQILLMSFKMAQDNNISKYVATISIMLGKFYIDFKNDDEEASKFLDTGVDILNEIGIINN